MKLVKTFLVIGGIAIAAVLIYKKALSPKLPASLQM
jgi:hypothetical protein